MAYNPQNGTLSNKSYAPSGAVSTDFRSRFFDTTLQLQRDYQSTAEVISYLDTTASRTGGFSIWINVGGTLDATNGTFTGGTQTEYYFKKPYGDADLVFKSSGGSGGGVWGGISGSISSQTDLAAALATKQATLVSGTNIKTINGTPITGGGDITVGGGSGGGIPDSFVNVKASPFNAVGDGVADDGAAIQTAINYAITNNIVNVFFPKGTYKSTVPHIIYKWDGAIYQQVTLNLVGEATFWGAQFTGSTIKYTSNTTFGIGIQIGKGCKIKNLAIQGSFTPPAGTDRSFYNLSSAAYTDGVSRDTRYSPNAGIVIDPFTQVTPSDGGYPTLTSMYRGSAGTSGSTGTEVTNCSISSFVIGFMTSPNGVTQNAEIQLLDKVQFANVKWCIVGCQPQEKANSATNIHCWGSAYGVFCNVGYGQQQAGNWFISKVNLAGRVIVIANAINQDLFPCTFAEIYAESTYSIGNTIGNYWDKIFIDFEGFGTVGFGAARIKGGVGNGSVFTNSRFRFYGTVGGIPITGAHRFINCEFSGLPITAQSPLNVSRNYFENCDVVYYGGTPSYKLGYKNNYLNYGDLVNTSSPHYMYGKEGIDKPDLQLVATSTDTIVCDGAGNGTLAGSGFLYGFKVGDMIGLSTGATVEWAKVSANNGTDVTLTGLSPNVVTGGNYVYWGAYDYVDLGHIMGDFTNGNKFITNAVSDNSKTGAPLASWLNKWFYHPYSNNPYRRVVSIAGTTMTLGYDNDANQTIANAIINNKVTQKFYYQTAAAWTAESATMILGVNDEVVIAPNSDAEVRSRVIRSGFKGTAPFAIFEASS